MMQNFQGRTAGRLIVENIQHSKRRPIGLVPGDAPGLGRLFSVCARYAGGEAHYKRPRQLFLECVTGVDDTVWIDDEWQNL